MRHWYVVVSQHGQFYTAVDEIFELGAEVSVPEERIKTRMATGGSAIVVKPLIEPYFFARFDASRNEEVAAVRACKGVEDVLCDYAQGEKGGPQAIWSEVIRDFERRQHQSMRAITVRHKKGRSDLKLLGQYKILRHATFQGHEGQLIAAERGIAHLRVGSFLVSVPDGDITLVSVPKVSPLVRASA